MALDAAKHGFPEFPLVFTTDKTRFCLDGEWVVPDLVIDDGPHNIEAAHRVGIPFLIFDAPYNRHLGDEHRVEGWGHALEVIHDLPSAA